MSRGFVNSKNFANVGQIVRFTLRRDRLRLPIWILGISLFTISIAALLPELYTTQADKIILAETMKNPAVTFMIGYSAGLANYTNGAMLGHFMIVFTGIFAAIMSILLVNRHVKVDEEEGRTEMINSLPVGNLSKLSATFVILCIAQVIIGLLIGIGLTSLSIETIDLEGSMLFGLSIAAVGIFYASLTGLFAQITSNARATLGLSFTLLIIDYIVRGIGDIRYEVLSYLSPLGLIVRTETYVNNRWWPLLVLIGVSLLIFGLSLYLNSIRDLDSGFIPARPGRSHASRFLKTPLGLVLRLQQTPIIAWMIGMLVVGIAYGSLLGELEGFLNTSELVQLMIPDVEGMSLTERFIVMLITIVSVIGTIPVVMFVLKLSSEEKNMRTEQLLANPISRNNLLASYTFVGFITAPIIQLMSVLGLWSAAAIVMEDVVSLKVLFQAAFVNVPAMWIFAGIAVFLTGCFPRLTGLTYVFLAYSFFVEYLGEILQLPEWLIAISPFYHIPRVPADEVEILALFIITVISLLLVVAGFISYNLRDLEG